MSSQDDIEQPGGVDEQDVAPYMMARPVTQLTEYGISAADVKKLQDAGYNTVESLAFTAKKGAFTRSKHLKESS